MHSKQAATEVRCRRVHGRADQLSSIERSSPPSNESLTREKGMKRKGLCLSPDQPYMARLHQYSKLGRRKEGPVPPEERTSRGFERGGGLSSQFFNDHNDKNPPKSRATDTGSTTSGLVPGRIDPPTRLGTGLGSSL